MSDPAIEAAQSAFIREGWGDVLQLSEGHLAVAAAREALKPIRDELDTLAYVTKPPCDFGTLLSAYEKAIDRISRHCYTSEELKA